MTLPRSSCARKSRETVRDPAVAALLMPRDYPIGTKRLCIDIDYYETYNRDNVTLVDVRTAPIQELTPHGLRTETSDYELDAIVFAIGFDAMTGALFDVDLRGRAGESLKSQLGAGSAHLPGTRRAPAFRTSSW